MGRADGKELEEIKDSSPNMSGLLEDADVIPGFLQEVPMYEVWGPGAKKTAEQAVKLPTNKTATKAFHNPKIKENAKAKSDFALGGYKAFTFLEGITSGAQVYNSYNDLCSNEKDDLEKISAGLMDYERQ